MPLFTSPIQTLKTTIEHSWVRWFLPSSLSVPLRQFNPSISHHNLQYTIIRAFFNIKRHSHYYATLARKIPSLRRFKTEIGEAIERRTFFHISQTLCEDLLFCHGLHESEIKICAEYFLMKARIWTPENQIRIDHHQSLSHIIKIMSLLVERDLLTQENFDLISESAQDSKDIAFLLAALERKHWLDHDRLALIRKDYKPKLGETILIAVNSEAGEQPLSFSLKNFARTILIQENAKNHPVYMHSVLEHFSKESTSIHLPLDFHYFASTTHYGFWTERFIKSIETHRNNRSDFFEMTHPKNNFSHLTFISTLSMSDAEIVNLNQELQLLQISLGRFVFDQHFFSILIHAVKQNDFESRRPLLTLLEEQNCSDPHIILALYNIRNNQVNPLLPSIRWLLSRPEFTHKQPIIRFYLEEHGPDLSELMVTSPSSKLPSYAIWTSMYTKSREVIDSLHHQYHAMLTPTLISKLLFPSFLKMIKWVLAQNDRLPYPLLNDKDMITLSKHPRVNEIMRIFEYTTSPVSFHFFSMITRSRYASNAFTELVSILPILKDADLTKESDIMALLLHLNRHRVRLDISAIIRVIILLSEALNRPLFNKLVRDKDISLLGAAASLINKISVPASHQAKKREFINMLKKGESSTCILSHFHEESMPPSYANLKF